MSRVLYKHVGIAGGDSTPTSDNSLKKFYKALIQKFSEDQPQMFNASNIKDVLGLLSN